MPDAFVAVLEVTADNHSPPKLKACEAQDVALETAADNPGLVAVAVAAVLPVVLADVLAVLVVEVFCEVFFAAIFMDVFTAVLVAAGRIAAVSAAPVSTNPNALDIFARISLVLRFQVPVSAASAGDAAQASAPAAARLFIKVIMQPFVFYATQELDS